MQKLFSRIGTESHKYRLALRFTSILIASAGYESPGVCYRVILQRGTKKYTTNYFSLILNTENAISQSIQVKATLFFDRQKNSYQQKKFDIVILRKDIFEEIPVAMFSMLAEGYIGYKGERIIFRDSAHKLEAFLVCERIDNSINGAAFSDTSSIDRSVDLKRRTYENRNSREASPIISNGVFPHLVTINHQQFPSGSSRVFTTEKTIIDQIRINSETSLHKSQQRSNQHLPYTVPHYPKQTTQIVHFNHPQHGGIPVNSPPQSGSRLLPPSPKKNQMPQLLSNSHLMYDPRISRAQSPGAPAYQLVAINFASPQTFTNQTALQGQLSSFQLNPAPVLTQPQFSTTPPLQAIRQNFRIAVTAPEQNEGQLSRVEKEQLPSSNDISSQIFRSTSKSPTFRDVINVQNQRIPVKRRNVDKKNDISKDQTVKDQETTTTQTKIKEADQTELTGGNRTSVNQSERDSLKAGVMILPSEITAVDSFVKPIERQAGLDSIKQNEDVFMSATFKLVNQNRSFEELPPFNKKTIEQDQIEYLKKENEKLDRNYEALQNQLFLREQFIRERQTIIDQQKLRIQTLLYENQELQNKCTALQTKVSQLDGVNRIAIKEYDQAISHHNDQLQQNNKQLQFKLGEALVHADQFKQKNQQLLQFLDKIKKQKTQLTSQITSITQKTEQLKEVNAKIGINNVTLGGVNAELNTKIAQLSTKNFELNQKIQKLQNELSVLQNKTPDPNPEMHRLATQMERIEAYNRNSIGQMEQIRAENEKLTTKHQDLIEKYIKNHNDLTQQKSNRQHIQKQLSQLQTQLETIIKAKDQEIRKLEQHIKQMRISLVNPDSDPNYRQMQTKIIELNQKIQLLSMQNSEQRNLYKRQMDIKRSDMDDLTQKFNQNQRILNETIAIWTLKEKSLSQAITVRDRRIAQLQNRDSAKSETVISRPETDRRQLLMKIQQLTTELERLQELDQQIAVVQASNKDLQGQVIKLNKRISLMLQLAYKQNSILAKELAKIKV